jgi:hypothetical protein
LSFDDVATGVSSLVQARRATSARAFGLAGGDLIGFLRDHRLDAPGGEHPADLARGVGLVRDHRIGPGPRPARALARYADVIEDLHQHRTVVALTAGEHDCQRHPIAIDRGVDLATQTAAGAADRMPLGLLMRQILVVRLRPLWAGQGGWCWSRAGGHG